MVECYYAYLYSSSYFVNFFYCITWFKDNFSGKQTETSSEICIEFVIVLYQSCYQNGSEV
jgi:hypothetical protein